MNDTAKMPAESTAAPDAAPADLTTRVQPSGASATPPADDDPPGDIPGYRLLGELARGGMGVVYQAHDPALNRHVAVKVLQERFRRSVSAVGRFVEEAQITAQLQHPGIPPVHQVGTLPDGRPFLAMKLIKGRTLADLLADPAWDRGQAAGAFEQICHTVAYAHDRGVIHRDLKPQNVMVGRFNEVQVMDWGLAKYRTAAPDRTAAATVASTFHDPRAAGSDDDETGAGSILGTPAYMPPEQAIGAVGQVDERSDVFGLGAILCTILTGRPPYVGADSESTRQLAALAKQDDARARLAACGADPELVALCRRCLSPDPAGRPADAGEVARSVAGLRAAADDRARKAELDRAAAAAEAREQRKRRKVQLALAAAVGLLVTVGGAFAWHADTKDREARSQRDRNADALADLLTRCETALRENDADRAAAAMAEADRRLAEPGGDGLAERAGRCRADLALLRELDAIDAFRWTPVDNKLPGRSQVLGRWRAALSGYGVETVGPSTASSVAAIDGSLLRERLLTVLDLWLAYEHSEPTVRALLGRADPDDFRDALRDAILAKDGARQAALAREPRGLEQPPRFAAAMGVLQTVSVELRRTLLEAALRQRPGDLLVLMVLGDSYPINQREGADDRARWYQAAVAAHPGSFTAHLGLGTALRDRGDESGAVAANRAAVRLAPTNAVAHLNLGVALLGLKDLGGAVAAYRQSIRLDPTNPVAHANLGLALRGQGDLGGAVAAYREAIRLNPTLASAYNGLGNALKDQGDLGGALAAFRETVRLEPRDAQYHFNLGVALAFQGDLAGQGAAFREAVRLDPNLAPAHNNLGVTLAAQRDPDGALVAFREAVRVDPKFAPAHNSLGKALADRKDVEGAVAAYREAIRVDPKLASAHNNWAWLSATGPERVRDGKRAVEQATRACELTRWNRPEFIDTLAAAYAAAGDFDRAVEYQTKALSFPAYETTSGQAGRERLEMYRQKKPYYDPAFFPRDTGPPPREVKP